MALSSGLQSMMFLLLMFSWLGYPGSAKIVQGLAQVPAGATIFLSKFCFDYDAKQPAGLFNITLRSLKRSSDNRSSLVERRVALVLFDDQGSSYPGASSAWDTMTCDEKLAHARSSWTLPAAAETEQGFNVLVPMREHIRPRWWYVALADCSGSRFSIEYSIHTWNPLHGWQSELSVDHYGVSRICFFFFVVYGITAAAQLWANAINKSRGRPSHPLVRILTIGIVCGMCAMALFVWHYIAFAYDGVGIFTFWILAEGFQTFSKFLLMSILLLVSQGRCVSRVMSTDDAWRVCKLLGPFMLICLVLELWGEFAQSRRYTTDFVYSTRFGKALVLVDLCFLVVYAVNLQASYHGERNAVKRYFYSVWGTVLGAWFLVLPSVVCLAHALAPWVRFKVVLAISNAAHAAAFAALVAGLWPTRQRSYFALDATELIALDEPFSVDYLSIGEASEWHAWKPLPGDPYSGF